MALIFLVAISADFSALERFPYNSCSNLPSECMREYCYWCTKSLRGVRIGWLCQTAFDYNTILCLNAHMLWRSCQIMGRYNVKMINWVCILHFSACPPWRWLRSDASFVSSPWIYSHSCPKRLSFRLRLPYCTCPRRLLIPLFHQGPQIAGRDQDFFQAPYQ